MDKIPVEVLEIIFSNLSSLSDVTNCFYTCKKWNEIVKTMFKDKGKNIILSKLYQVTNQDLSPPPSFQMTKEVKKLRQWLAYSNFAWKSSWILITSLDLLLLLFWHKHYYIQNKKWPVTRVMALRFILVMRMMMVMPFLRLNINPLNPLLILYPTLCTFPKLLNKYDIL